MPMNRLKAIFKRKSSQVSEDTGDTFSDSSPRYSYAYQSPYQQPRILILVDNVRATYFLSFHYVLERLHRKESLAFFVLDSGEVARWTKGKSPEAFVQQVMDDVQPTLVILSRYGMPHGDVLPALFKANKVATICHFDDDLLNLNPALGKEIQARQGDPAVQNARQILLEQSDLIYASTPFLAELYTQQFPQQQVFSGMYAPYLDFLLPEEELPPTQAQPLTVGYMGSKGHQEDLGMVADDIGRILTANPQIRFETFGTINMPPALKSFGQRVTSHKVNTDYAGFLNQLAKLNWDIGLAPLDDTQFNRCKAPTKYVEYTTCGIPTIASSGNVYSQFTPDSQILIAEPGEWAVKIQQLINDKSLRMSLVTNGQAYCAQTFNLDVLEAQIKELLALV